jgi:hypothetical protein
LAIVEHKRLKQKMKRTVTTTRIPKNIIKDNQNTLTLEEEESVRRRNLKKIQSIVYTFSDFSWLIYSSFRSQLNRNKVLGEEDDTEIDDEDEEPKKKNGIPQYVNIRRQRPSTTEETSTSKYN